MLSGSNPQKPSEKIIYAQISEKQNTITNLRIKMQKQEKQMQALEKTIKEKDKEVKPRNAPPHSPTRKLAAFRAAWKTPV